MWRGMQALAVLALLGGCGSGDAPDAEEGRYRLALDGKQLMNWIVDPSAKRVWSSAGSVVTEAGEEDLSPRDDQTWEQVRNAAAVVVESGNLLMLPGRSRGDDWNEFSQGLITIGERVLDAAERRDADALFEVGGQLYNVCVACHQQYLLPQQQAPRS